VETILVILAVPGILVRLSGRAVAGRAGNPGPQVL